MIYSHAVYNFFPIVTSLGQGHVYRSIYMVDLSTKDTCAGSQKFTLNKIFICVQNQDYHLVIISLWVCVSYKRYSMSVNTLIDGCHSFRQIRYIG